MATGFAEESLVPEEEYHEEPRSTICNLHPGEKCDFYCDDCRDPLCADCMVSLSEGPHRTHRIRKLRDVLTTYNTQHKDAVQLVTDMNVGGKQRAEELLEELVLSRDSLLKEAKSKHDEAHQEADRWYQNTTATITKMYDQLHAQILQFMSRSDLQDLQQSLEKIDLQNIDVDMKQGQGFLDQLQMSVTSFKKSTVWPTKFWSVDVGKITDDFTVDLGNVTEPTLNLPDVNSFPYTIEQMLENTEVATSDVRKQTGKPPGFRLLSDLPMEPGCNLIVGMTTNEAVVCFEGQSTIKKISLNRNQIVLRQSPLPHDISESCMKYILNNNNVLLRKYQKGPGYLLNSQLELVSTIHEDYNFIIGAESTHWVAFCKGNGTSIQIYDLEQKQLLQTLTPPAGVKWEGTTSICRHPDSQFTAVVDHYRNLCVYDHDGRHLHEHILQFDSYAIACNRRHLYVASWNPVSVSVYSWSGQLVTTLDTQQLGISEGYRIWNMAVGEDKFAIAVGLEDEEDSFTVEVVVGNAVTNFKTFQCV